MNEASDQLFAELTANNIGNEDGRARRGRTMTRRRTFASRSWAGPAEITERAWTAEQARELAEGISAGRAKVEFEIAND